MPEYFNEVSSVWQVRNHIFFFFHIVCGRYLFSLQKPSSYFFSSRCILPGHVQSQPLNVDLSFWQPTKETKTLQSTTMKTPEFLLCIAPITEVSCSHSSHTSVTLISRFYLFSWVRPPHTVQPSLPLLQWKICIQKGRHLVPFGTKLSLLPSLKGHSLDIQHLKSHFLHFIIHV